MTNTIPNVPRELKPVLAMIFNALDDLIAFKSAPVVMPDRRAQALAGVSLFDLGHAKGWNACLDEVERLNGGQKG